MRNVNKNIPATPFSLSKERNDRLGYTRQV